MNIGSLEITTVNDEYISARFISPSDFTRMTSLSRFKLRELIETGQIIARRCDGRILVDMSSVNRWVKSCSATIWMGKQRQSGWPFWRSRRGDDCCGASITQALFCRETI